MNILFAYWISMCDKSRNTWLCVHWQWNTREWCQLNALQASPVVHLVTPLSCVSLSMNTQPSVPAITTHQTKISPCTICNRNVHTCVYFCWCIMGYGTGAMWDLCSKSIIFSRIHFGGVYSWGATILPIPRHPPRELITAVFSLARSHNTIRAYISSHRWGHSSQYTEYTRWTQSTYGTVLLCFIMLCMVALCFGEVYYTDLVTATVKSLI